MKKIVSLGLLGATTSLMAMYAEQASLYKDPRIMGMGGANVAVGAYSTAVFSNPAGLTNIKKEHGFVVDLLSVGVSASGDIANFTQDLSDAQDSDNATDETSKVLEKYSGKHFHISYDASLLSISKNSDAFAWSVGFFGGSDINLMAHGNGSANAELLETTSRVYGGGYVGVAKPYETKIGYLDVGMSFKYVSQLSYEGTLGISELVGDDDVAKKLQDRYEKESSGFGMDLGVTYRPFASNYWHPAVGFSILNIGSINMEDNYGGQPTTLNVGVSVTPDVPYISKLVLAADYVDILNANKLRIYNYNANGDTVSYTDYDSSDMIKNLRLGIGMGLVDTRFFSTSLNGGIYQGSYTAGLNLEVLAFKLNIATYEEEVGDSTSSISDRRYVAQLAIGW
jgi:hypothetical protein